METAGIIMRAQTDSAERELFIKENTAFIHGCAAQAAGHFVDENDDVFSEALTAFNNAITVYKEEKGYFHVFAKACIHNRIKDYYRAQKRHSNVIPFSSLSAENDNGEEIAFETEDKNAGVSGTAFEICSLKAELEPFGISFFDLPKAAPKSKKTRKACVDIVRYITEHKELLDSVREKKVLPVKQVMTDLKVNQKIFERHRKYLIMGILITDGGYEILSEYFDAGDRR